MRRRHCASSSKALAYIGRLWRRGMRFLAKGLERRTDGLTFAGSEALGLGRQSPVSELSGECERRPSLDARMYDTKTKHQRANRRTPRYQF